MRTSMPRALCSSGLPCVPGTRIMSPNAVKITSGCCGDGQAIVDAAHGKHAHRAAGTVDQFDVGRQQILQAEAVDGVGVAAADFHDAVVPRGSARRRISSAVLVMSSGSRNSSTNRMVDLLPRVRLLPVASERCRRPILQAVTLDLLHGRCGLAQRVSVRIWSIASSSLILLMAKPT